MQNGCETLRVNAIRWSGYVYPEKLKHPPLPSGCEISGCKMSVHGIPPRVDWAMQRKEDRGARKDIRINSIRIPQEDIWCAPLSGLPQGETHGTHEHHTRTIGYPIRICCPDHWLRPPSDGVSGRPVRTSFAPCIPDLLMAKDFKALVLHVFELSIALPWIPKNSPQSRIALVIKKLSKHQNLTQFD